MDDSHLRPQGAEEVSQLGGDVASAQDDEPPRLLRQAERLVGGDVGDVGQSLDLRHGGPGAGGDDDRLCRDALIAYL